MSSSVTSSSLARSRSLRIAPSHGLKPVSTPTPQPPSGPSNITLFLTNLRLLDLDLRSDWPDISALTFSTKEAQQNQKKRIQCVEWALYQLFTLWDPEEARNKLQPFFPPLEPLQSLNLRAALFRCLDQAKKNGVLGRDTVLRKTMLDECKGERLDEVLAVFSNVVLKKVLQQGDSHEYQALAKQLALENFSYTGERTLLSMLIVAHKAALSRHLRERHDCKERYSDFTDLLDLNERRLARRHEQLKQAIEETHNVEAISGDEVRKIQEKVQRNWAGNPEWLQTILYGDSTAHSDGVLARPFEKVWKHVEDGSIGEIEGKQKVGLLEQLDARLQDQERRLNKWQEFEKVLSKKDHLSPAKKSSTAASVPRKIDLGFNQHQTLQIGRGNSEPQTQTSAITLDEYSRLIENMKSELAEVGTPHVVSRPPVRQSVIPDSHSPLGSQGSALKDESPGGDDEEWSSASDTDEPDAASYATKSTSRTPPSEAPKVFPRGRTKLQNSPHKKETIIRSVSPPRPDHTMMHPPPRPSKIRTPSPEQISQMPPPPKPKPRTPSPEINSSIERPINTMPMKDGDSESDLADQILSSISAASPSPKKPRHTLSLAERTRLSMSRTSHSQYSDLHDEFEIADLPRLSLKSRPSIAPRTPSVEEPDKHADLIERTRKSMAGFEAAQKKAQLERRRSVKDAKKKQRESSYFPKVEEEVVTPDISAIELMEGDPDYESVFKSRPKIKTSPAVSPTRIWEGNED